MQRCTRSLGHLLACCLLLFEAQSFRCTARVGRWYPTCCARAPTLAANPQPTQEQEQQKAQLSQQQTKGPVLLVDMLRGSLMSGTFVRATIGSAKAAIGSNETPALLKVQVRLVELKKGVRLQLQCTYPTSDITKNYEITKGLAQLETLLRGASTARVFTTVADFAVEKPRGSVKQYKATFQHAAPTSHDRIKKRRLALEVADFGHATQSQASGNTSFLIELGVLSSTGIPRKGMAEKYRQIERFVEIVESLVDQADFEPRDFMERPLTLLDLGAGKGYLTFAVYSHLRAMGFPARVIGVDVRRDVVDKANAVTVKLRMDGLEFKTGRIEDVDATELIGGEGSVDIVVALHACDTATDDALYLGLKLGARIIMTAPCCHKEIRQEMLRSFKAEEGLAPELTVITRHGILLERQAELVTDSLRALLLEEQGYRCQVQEFVAQTHTAKNLLIAGVRRKRTVDEAETDRLREKREAFLAFHGVKNQRLLDLVQGSTDRQMSQIA